MSIDEEAWFQCGKIYFTIHSEGHLPNDGPYVTRVYGKVKKHAIDLAPFKRISN
ncbi:MAG: hypothetical protein PHY16_03165 [Methylobacter sp.]|nr:hypothetical protein [Methylobacter sp.]